MSDSFDDVFTSTQKAIDEYLSQPSIAIVGGKRKEIHPGQNTQYSLYGGGYKPSSATVNTLPPSVYEIISTDNGAVALPLPPPEGLLLELPEMRSEEVIKVVETFWASEDDYKLGNDFVQGGALYKSGVMLYGPPGSGKSCTIKLISKKIIERGGTVFYSGTHPSVTNTFLTAFSRIENNRKCVVILEDIDSLIESWGEAAYLEMLDSAKTINNVIFIATTNYPDRLDPRIYNRPGRFSHVIKIGLPTEAARRAYLKALLKNHRDIEEIVSSSDGFTIDHLTAVVNAVYREKKELKTELKRLKNLFNIPKSEDKNIGINFKDDL